MKIDLLCLAFSLIASPIYIPIVLASNSTIENVPEFITSSNFQQKFDKDKFSKIMASCKKAARLSLNSRLRELTHQLERPPALTGSFDLDMERAKILLACKAPESSKKLLQRLNPNTANEKEAWSILFWQASNAVMDHKSAALALRRLAEGDLQKLDQKMIFFVL